MSSNFEMTQNMFMLFSWLLSFTFSNCAVDFIELQQTEQIQNILIDNGIIYVGATNKILKLDSNFKTIGTYETGPHYDDASCIEFSSTDCTDESRKKYFETKPNENQFLLLLSTNSLGDSLMACGNSQLGQCEFLNATSLTKLKLMLIPSGLQLASREIGGTFVGQVMTLGNSKVLVSARTLVKLQGDKNDIIRVLSLESEYFLQSYKNKRRMAYSLSYDRNKVSKNIEHQYKFISIMQFSDYTYFFSVYQNITDSTTKVIRMNVTENDFGFYIEKPLQCSKNGKDYKILKSISVVKLTDQAAKVLKSTTDQYVVFGLFKTIASDFAVCYFDVSEIQNSIEKSLSAEKSPKAFWFTQSDDTICLSSENVIKGTLLYESNGVHHHTLVAFPHERGITVFLSSQSSSVYEFAVNKGTLYKYAEVHFPINDIMMKQIFTQVAVYEDNLYFSGSRFVARMSIKNCTRRTTCLSCLSGSSCGWCTLEKRCTLRSECLNNLETLRFINEANDTCPSVINIFPNVIEITSKVDIDLTVLGVPVDVTYKCSFNELVTPLKRHDTIFTCTSMDLETIPNLKIEDGAGTVNLSIVTEDTLKSVVDTTFSVYMCSSFKMCTKCITSANSCGWCVKDMKCVDKAENCHQKDEWLPHIGVQSSSSDVKCPLINNIQNSLYSNGSKNDISLTGKYLLKPEDGINYQCYFKMISEKNITSSARWISETQIICDSTELFYQEAVSFKTADLSVFMGESAIDVERVAVEIFKCSFDETDCTTCKNNPKKWNCVWCKSKQTCVTTDACDFIPTDESCPAPVISKLDPMKGPIKGRTTLSIFGKDLGSTFSDIISVRVAGVQCSLKKDLYQISKKVVCELNGPDVQDEGDVIVEVNSTTLHRTEWDSKFYFKEPLVNKGSPEVGPCSGETIISIEGKDLDIGNNAVVKVAGVSCSKVTRSKTIINCTTTPGCLQLTKEVNSGKLSGTKRKKREVTSTASVSIEIDGFKLKVPDHVKFEYKTDPLVTQIYTYKESIHLETFASGGQVLTVEGQRLNIVKQPQMTFYSYNHDLTRKTDCRFVTKTEQSKMICLAPNISSAFDSSVKSITVMLGFVLDGVVNVKSFKNITVFADPVFNSFPDILEMKTSTLILSGAGFRVLSKKDVNVSVGESECRVTDLGENLVCELPSEQELKEKNAGSSYPVVVYVGEKGTGLMFNVGSITFYAEAPKESSLTLYITAASAAVALLLVIIVVLACLYHRKQKRQKEYQALYKVKVNKMELDYARECKEAFTGYMIGVSDLTNEVENVKLSPLHFHQYAMRVLYPGLIYHPILEGDKDESEEWKCAMRSFIKLMKEKDFILTFIRTLESQSSFQMTDRCTVASLLMVAMQDDLRFATSVLTMLLVDLINKASNGKRPKLLLRRTESVAEKLLTNWLAYTLHDFLEEHVGQKLFKLFTAINIHLEKEPIDAITSEAKNSLSEDKFLRLTIEFKTIVLNIEYICEGTSKVYEGISVLTCDTISQTKEKIIKHIYKNRPYKEWPNVEELSLGFASANGALLVLQDEDATNNVSGEWKKLNTLEHYKVPDHSSLRLAPAPVTPPYEYGSAAQLLSTSFQTTHASSPLLNVKDNPHEHKLWHMVKSSEYPQEHNDDQRNSKTMTQNIATEVFLTRLLKTKETLHLFVNDLFNSIFGLDNGVRTIPLSVKYLFDFLDTEANKLDISDNEVHHTWKNNSLPLRFWINIIKNPNFFFDVKKSSTVDSCLSVIAQLFMDSCSPDEHKLGTFSPSNKLLYAKEIPDYKKIVKRFYEDVRKANFSMTEFEEYLDQISQKYGGSDSFNALNAASELMTYAVKYKVKIMDNLEHEGFNGFAEDLQKIMESMPDD